MKPTGKSMFRRVLLFFVLGALVWLLYPSLKDMNLSTSRPASRPPAEGQARQLANAIRAYETEYGQLPLKGASDVTVNMDGELLEILLAHDTDRNPRGIVFVEEVPWIAGKGGIEGGAWKDPWGNPYRVSLDLNGDNQVAVSESGENTGTNTLANKVAVWNVTSDPDKQARSWKKQISSTLRQKPIPGMWNYGPDGENMALYLAEDGSGDLISHDSVAVKWSYDPKLKILSVRERDGTKVLSAPDIYTLKYMPQIDSLTLLPEEGNGDMQFKRQLQSAVDAWLEVKRKSLKK